MTSLPPNPCAERLLPPTDSARPAAYGPSIMLGSGSYYDYTQPHLTTPTPEDIGYGLGFGCRFAGQAVSAATARRVFYSIAQHCVIGSYHVPQEHAYAFLMHEGGESVCLDVTGPLKSIAHDYRRIEHHATATIHAQYHSTPADPQLIKQMDYRMLATEKRDLMLPALHHTWDFVKGAQPLPTVITPIQDPHHAALLWLSRYHELAPPNAPTLSESTLNLLRATKYSLLP